MNKKIILSYDILDKILFIFNLNKMRKIEICQEASWLLSVLSSSDLISNKQFLTIFPLLNTFLLIDDVEICTNALWNLTSLFKNCEKTSFQKIILMKEYFKYCI